jgi:hypothetical protein
MTLTPRRRGGGRQRSRSDGSTRNEAMKTKRSELGSVEGRKDATTSGTCATFASGVRRSHGCAASFARGQARRRHHTTRAKQALDEARPRNEGGPRRTCPKGSDALWALPSARWGPVCRRKVFRHCPRRMIRSHRVMRDQFARRRLGRQKTVHVFIVRPHSICARCGEVAGPADLPSM